jgi:hypothetical protein
VAFYPSALVFNCTMLQTSRDELNEGDGQTKRGLFEWKLFIRTYAVCAVLQWSDGI